MNEKDIIDSTLAELKKDDRKSDAMTYMKELEDCKSTEQVKELSDWYLSKPKVE